MPDNLLIRRLVFLPQCALGAIGHRKLPVLRGLIQSREKTLALLSLRYVEEELQDNCAVAREVALEGRDVLKPLAPDIPGNQRGRNLLLGEDLRMHPHHQALFIIRTIEDTDAAT